MRQHSSDSLYDGLIHTWEGTLRKNRITEFWVRLPQGDVWTELLSVHADGSPGVMVVDQSYWSLCNWVQLGRDPVAHWCSAEEVYQQIAEYLL